MKWGAFCVRLCKLLNAPFPPPESLDMKSKRKYLSPFLIFLFLSQIDFEVTKQTFLNLFSIKLTFLTPFSIKYTFPDHKPWYTNK